MGTRSIIARRTEAKSWFDGDTFIGRYCHYDGYPTGTGVSILRAVKQLGFKKAVSVLLDEHPAGWSAIAGVDWTKEIGLHDYPYPKGWDRVTEDYDRNEYPQCYCHEVSFTTSKVETPKSKFVHKREEKEGVLDNNSAFGCEYAYVIDEGSKMLTVYERTPNTFDVQWSHLIDVSLDNVQMAQAQLETAQEVSYA